MPFFAVGARNLLVTLYLSPCTVHTSLGFAERHGFSISGAVVCADSSTELEAIAEALKNGVGALLAPALIQRGCHELILYASGEIHNRSRLGCYID